MPKFKVGDLVKICKSSEYYREDRESNPRDIEGVVIEVRTGGSSPLKVKVNWDNGESNSYTHEDLVYADEKGNKDELTVDREFVMAAYKSACSDWKKKIEAKFPDLFPNPYAKIVKDENSIGVSNLFYLDSNDEYKALEYNIALIDGIAGHGRDVPLEARYRGIYVNNRKGELDLELVETEDGYAIVFKNKSK